MRIATSTYAPNSHCDQWPFQRTIAILTVYAGFVGCLGVKAALGRLRNTLASIDFGTTYCSVAYILKDILKLPLDGPLTRVPNAILIEKEINRGVVFGYHAQDQFSQLKKRQEKFYLFERMKMILYCTQISH